MCRRRGGRRRRTTSPLSGRFPRPAVLVRSQGQPRGAALPRPTAHSSPPCAPALSPPPAAHRRARGSPGVGSRPPLSLCPPPPPQERGGAQAPSLLCLPPLTAAERFRSRVVLRRLLLGRGSETNGGPGRRCLSGHSVTAQLPARSGSLSRSAGDIQCTAGGWGKCSTPAQPRSGTVCVCRERMAGGAGSSAGLIGAPQLRGPERAQPTAVWLFKSCFVKMRLFRGVTN